MRRLLAVALLIMSCEPLPGAQGPSVQRYAANASVLNSSGPQEETHLTVRIEHFASKSDQDALMASLKRNGTPGARLLLMKAFDAGLVRIGQRLVPIKYATSRPTGQGRLLTLMTAEPIRVTDDDVRPELGLIILVIPDTEPGYGELIPATKVRFDPSGAIVTDNYRGRVILLSNVTTE